MSREKKDSHPTLFPHSEHSSETVLRRRRPLVLPRLLSDEATRLQHGNGDVEAAHKIILRWADLESDGHVFRKETSLDAEFLNQIFGEALGFRLQTISPQRYNLEREFSLPGGLSADGALGDFGPESMNTPVAVIELKDATTNVDRDTSNGRTAVQQCWGYLNAAPACPWGIVSNFVMFRLYHRNKTPMAFEIFTLQELRDARRFREFFCLFSRIGLLPSRLVKEPTALRLLRETDNRQREVGDDLYETYRQNRLALIDHLHRKANHSVDAAIRIAQKIMDRIIFVAFCEDRGLLPDRIIERTYDEVQPFAKVTNPRWQNFLGLFRAVDKGHKDLSLETGYNGGLFRRDPEVDDLQLDDDWTRFFREVSGYDFRDEINVDVLGHLFEKSITELEKLRSGGLFDASESPLETAGKMPKSAQRKRFGIYYTPPAFTSFIVQHTVVELIDERFVAAAKKHGLDPARPEETGKPKKVLAYLEDCLEILRAFKVCDPACGSGAFLIKAYDVFEERYGTLLEHMLRYDKPRADELRDQVPDIILNENLYGVDLSEQAIEITQLALWIRSARKGRTLSDLSANIVCGNSLVTDTAVDPRAMSWRDTFGAVFSQPEGGFDCVVSNPPWERLKLQEREFFSFSAPKIASAVNAGTRRTLIDQLEHGEPTLFARYTAAKTRAEVTLNHVRNSGVFPLTGKGDINTYALFAELAKKIVAPNGRVGILVPSGIATDKSTKDFFGSMIQGRSLIQLLDFENRKRVFPDVDGRFKFSILIFGGSAVEVEASEFVFFAHSMQDVQDTGRHICLTAEDIALLNPNTRTCPIFRSQRDAELTKQIYRTVPVLIDRSRSEGGNPWRVSFLRMFDQTNDAELFLTPEQLKRKRFKRRGSEWTKGRRRFVPLYEAKMVQAYDHRAAGVVIDTENWVRQGQTIPTSLVSHQNPEFVVEPRWWVEASEVAEACPWENPPAYLCYKDVTSPTNERTMIAGFIPPVGVVNSAPLVFVDESFSPRRWCCLLANLNAFVLDYVARQKVGNVHLNFFIVEQLPFLPPDAYDDRCPWQPPQKLEKWISDRVLKLSCTADDMRALGEACGMKNPVHKWKPTERATLLAELDAAYFLLYGIKRDDVEYILSTFTGTRRRDETETGTFRTSELVLHAYDDLAGACSTSG